MAVIRRHIVSTWIIIKEAYQLFTDNKAMRMSAALAYYTVFSIAPMLIVIISLCDIFYGKAAIEGNIYGQIQGFVGKEAALQIEQVIDKSSLESFHTHPRAIIFYFDGWDFAGRRL